MLINQFRDILNETNVSHRPNPVYRRYAFLLVWKVIGFPDEDHSLAKYTFDIAYLGNKNSNNTTSKKKKSHHAIAPNYFWEFHLLIWVIFIQFHNSCLTSWNNLSQKNFPVKLPCLRFEWHFPKTRTILRKIMPRIPLIWDSAKAGEVWWNKWICFWVTWGSKS